MKVVHLSLMGVLRNHRRELFAQAIVGNAKDGINLTQAYRLAGYVGEGHVAEVGGSRLMSYDEVRRRVAELQAPIVRKVETTLEHLIADVLADRELARSLKQPSAAIKATALLAALTGHLTRRSETGKAGEFSGLMTSEQILELIRRDYGQEVAEAIKNAVGARPRSQPRRKNESDQTLEFSDRALG
jgi:hypothetical protein